MMLVIKTHSQKTLNGEIQNDSDNEYKIVECPDLTEDQKLALVAQATPLIQKRFPPPDHEIQEVVTGWSWENDDYVTVKEQAQKDSTGALTYPEPAFPYNEAILWEPHMTNLNYLI